MVFKPNDFLGAFCDAEAYGGDHLAHFSDAANELFQEWLATQPTVYCRNDNGKWACDEHEGFARTTHKGKLVYLEEKK